LPITGVTSYGVASSATSERVTTPSSLIRAHAPDQNPPFDFTFRYLKRSLQVAVSPCWKLALPDIISTILAWLPGPLPRSVSPVHLPVSSRRTSASPQWRQVRHTDLSLQCNFNRGVISRLQSFSNVQASMLARSPDCTYRCGYSHMVARPFTPRIARLVTCPEMWYHYMPESGNWHDRTFTRWIVALSAAPATFMPDAAQAVNRLPLDLSWCRDSHQF
jgi:hypothetical protein